ncbi:unnamed protein product [Cyclocybe aegerita]|uniref:Chitin synthase n=1 Tax=Cyclocybe aegerita TaxID=1973307 RepID=A0A8S0VYI1_CYCAE|nr:unnamed protein product [Cyclocybe aegerita]
MNTCGNCTDNRERQVASSSFPGGGSSARPLDNGYGQSRSKFRAAHLPISESPIPQNDPFSVPISSSWPSPLGRYSPISPKMPLRSGRRRVRPTTRRRHGCGSVVECPLRFPVDTKIPGAEYTLRYTAATCDPDDFNSANGYTLRGSKGNQSTEALIAITAFNENAVMYGRTLSGVFANIQDICTSQRSKYWRSCVEDGNPAWQRITAALVVDGLDEMDNDALDLLAKIGVCQTGIMKKQVQGRETTAHIFEAKNQKKINSHRWIFDAVGKILKPEVCILVDAGTKPGPNAIYRLWQAFHDNPNLGGSCGEIHPMGGRPLLNPLVAAQNFEYKMSNILDKPLESTFGYVTVLPGAFSAYRYRAILGRPLELYFKGDHSLARRLGKDNLQGLSMLQKNMFLAEDRILCFELIAKEGEKWTISYVKDSKAETDVPECTAELLSQRRRWLNGALAANVYALANFHRLYRSKHGWRQLVLYQVQAIYNALSLVFSWFTLANVWLGSSMLLDNLSGYAPYPYVTYVDGVSKVIKYAYLVCLALQFLLAFGNRPKSERLTFNIPLWFFAFLTIYLMAAPGVWSRLAASSPRVHPPCTEVLHSASTPTASGLAALLVPLSSAVGIYVVASLLYLDPWHLLHSSLQYLCMGPSFINVLTVYAFCNLHDVSWGTKGCDKLEVLTPLVTSFTRFLGHIHPGDKMRCDRGRQESQMKAEIEDLHKSFRTRVVILWLLSNAILAIAVENLGGWLNLNDPSITIEQVQLFHRGQTNGRRAYLSVLLCVAYWFVLLRFVGSIVYWVRNIVFSWRRKRS